MAKERRGAGTVDRTEAAIMDVCGQLLEEKPLSKITVREIAERCGVNRNTFYYHFRDIPSLLERMAARKADEIIGTHGHLESMLDCVVLISQYCTEHRQAILHIYRSVQREAFLLSLERLALYAVQEFVDSAAAGLTLLDQDRQLLIWHYKCLLIGICLDWLDASMSYDLPAAAEPLCALFLDAVRQVFRTCSARAQANCSDPDTVSSMGNSRLVPKI